jgi:FKBP-type peptidyl-prolyl cis-trans isomerase
MENRMRSAAVLLPLALAAAAGACDLDTFRATPLRPPADLMETMHVSRDDLETTRSGLQRADVEVGTGTEATPGRVVVVHYTGRLTNGDTFDSSRKRDQPFSFTLGAGEVIQGWDEGVAGMRVGGKRALVIPPSLGYGARAVGPIPANSTLVFDVELLDVR